MATALDVIRRSMRLIGALAEGEVPTSEQASDALDALQAMLGEWETRGVRLGSVVDTTYGTADSVYVPVTHLQALAFNLAVVIAPEYGAADRLSAVLPQAERAFDALHAQYLKVPIVGVDAALVSQSSFINGPREVNFGQGDPIESDTGPLYP